MDKATIGRRVKVARETAGLTQSDVGLKLGIHQSAVANIEAGRRSVSGTELVLIADAVGMAPVSLIRRDLDNLGFDSLLRSVQGVGDSQRTRNEISKASLLFIEGAVMCHLLGIKKRILAPLYMSEIPKSVIDAIDLGETVANAERQRLGLGWSSIPNMSDLISKQGIWASAIEFPDDISGLFLRHDSFGMAILVNSYHSRARKRFSYAHEYGHALMDRERNSAVSSQSNSKSLVEKRANAFATAFLMPEEGVKRTMNLLSKGNVARSKQAILDVASGECLDFDIRRSKKQLQISFTDVARLARSFGVSYQATCYRIKSLGYIKSNELNSLLSFQLEANSYIRAIDSYDDLERIEPKSENDRSLKQELLHLSLEAYRQGKISRGRLVEMHIPLGVSLEFLISQAEAIQGVF